MYGSVCNSTCLDYDEFSNIVHELVKSEYFAKGTEKRNFLSNLVFRDKENLLDYDSAKGQDPVASKAY